MDGGLGLDSWPHEESRKIRGFFFFYRLLCFRKWAPGFIPSSTDDSASMFADDEGGAVDDAIFPFMAYIIL